ncbi:MAG TPA: Na+/H+ antiporter NhaA [Edaphocola sp.]|nr:Na+/H+ antiporter NhaA [Edaphocola sp.]
MPRKTKKKPGLKRYVLSPIREFIQDSRAVGIVLIICTFISLFIANSGFNVAYLNFWAAPIHTPISGLAVPHDLTAFVNDALMAVFFFLAGMEIKREMLIGELSSIRQSALPVIAAIGGMIIPATIYLFWNHDTSLAHGWGIPMATDIAFSLGILSLLGKGVPMPLKILLTALAIIDDLGAIIAIAVFYTADIHWLYLGLAGCCLLILVVLNLLKVRRLYLYFLAGAVLWYGLFNSGVHATLAGVLLAFTIPLSRIPKLEHHIHDPVNFIILPVFALANTAIPLPAHTWSSLLKETTTYGIAGGLILGKPLGIFLFAFLAVKLKLARLPKGLNWRHVVGMGMIAGIGFTMSIFISMLAFNDPADQVSAKIAVLAASLISAITGYLYLKRVFKKAF